MSSVFPQVGVHRLLQEGIYILKENIDILDDIFAYYTCEGMNKDYGQSYVDQIKKWFSETKIPVVQAWSMNISKVPMISVQLAQESEDETKSAIGDHWGEDEDGNVGVGVFTVMIDINLFGTKNSDEVLWLYYICNYIMFKRKRRAEELGLQLHTFSATDYARDIPKLPENVWVRTIRFKTTVENFWSAESAIDIDDLELEVNYSQVGVETCEDDD
jgi:hypothetical protein